MSTWHPQSQLARRRPLVEQRLHRSGDLHCIGHQCPGHRLDLAVVVHGGGPAVREVRSPGGRSNDDCLTAGIMPTDRHTIRTPASASAELEQREAPHPSGEARTEHYATALGYPAEIIPVTNPYSLKVGGALRFKTLVDGKPAANQYVLYGGRTPSGGRIEARNVRSGADGTAEIKVNSAGVWYIKFINMTPVKGDPEANYESKWATLTFEVR